MHRLPQPLKPSLMSNGSNSWASDYWMCQVGRNCSPRRQLNLAAVMFLVALDIGCYPSRDWFRTAVRKEGTSIMPNAKTILVVDDDMELSDGLRSVLERQGYRVFQARDGQQGKQLVYQHHPDLVILDMMMPRMGGYPVLEHFRGKSDAPPIIMITANEGSRHKAYAEYLVVVDYIRKPFAMERLLEAVNKAFGSQKDGEQAEQAFGGAVDPG